MLIKCKEVNETMKQPQEQDALARYLALFERAHAVVGDASVAATLVEQVAKDARCVVLSARAGGGDAFAQNGGDAPATEKQRGFLHDLGVTELPEGLTKAQASRLIDEHQHERGY